MQSLQENGFLKKDNFAYIAKHKHCIKSLNSRNIKFLDCVEKFKNKLEELRSSNTNVILSDQDAPMNLKANKRLILKLKNTLKGWRVCVVGTYRRHFDWLLSEYDQENQGTPQFKMVSRTIMTLTEFYESLGNNRLYAPLDLSLVKIIAHHFDDFYLFNMHQDLNTTTNSASTNIITRFLCESIPEAKHLCVSKFNYRL